MKNNVISYNLLDFRKANHLSQQQVAKLLNISQQAYSKYEHGETEPDIDTLLKFSELYHVSIDHLLNNQNYIIDFNKNQLIIPDEKKETVQQLLALPEKMFTFISGEINAYYQASQLN